MSQTKNNFFADNAIKIDGYRTFSNSFSAKTLQNPFDNKSTTNDSPSKRTKRVTSVVSNRLNPDKFRHREVFNHKLYTEKPFKIAVDFNKKQINQLSEIASTQVGKKMIQLFGEDGSRNCSIRLAQAFQKCNHHFEGILKLDLLKATDIKHPVQDLYESVIGILELCRSEIQKRKMKNSQLLCKLKVHPQMQQRSRILTAKCATNSSLKTPFSSQNLIPSSSIHLGTNESTNNKNLNHQINSQKTKYWYEQKIKKLNQKIKELQFLNKKGLLLNESTQQKLQQSQQDLLSAKTEIQKMQEKVDQVKQIENAYEYKIKKLKEELQVAHIVKEQNLADKMKFIMEI